MKMEQKEFRKRTYKEMKGLIKHFKGKDIRIVVPAVCATFEYYAKEQFPNMRNYITKEMKHAAKRISK